ncbi:MAG TPA: papain-like cysteine protease family protein [Vicinamibacterales bacterium]|nr:papain-like cysteine protease family protein [Vicinamibacterales bacterium]
MERERRAGLLLALALFVHPSSLHSQSLTVVDVPFIAQSELLCGGAAAAMVMRYWGERGVDAESFRSLVDPKAGGIRTDALAADLRGRDWNATALEGSSDTIAEELRQGRPVIALVEERPRTYHFVVVVARNADGVVFHDPARAPFRVMSAADFDKRWAAARRWMLVVTPPAGWGPPVGGPSPASPAISSPDEGTVCDAQIASAIQQAQQNRLEESERTLVGALSCPGAAVFRELAGLRVVQRRWAEAADLASSALAREPGDAYALRLLATARFIGDDQLGALDAWNQTREPRIDLVRIDGLIRTRYGVVERSVGLKPGEVLTRSALVRARRRLNELPSGFGTIDFVPVSSGLAEVRATVVERSIAPRNVFDLAVVGLATAVTRELVVPIVSPTGGGEQITADWRFWAHRPLYQLSIAAPAPWGGIWSVGVRRERQPFTATFSPTLHDSVQLDVADWMNGVVRWQIGGGIDRWNEGPVFRTAAATMRVTSTGDRLDARGQLRGWFDGGNRFGQAAVRILARSAPRLEGFVVTADAGVAGVTDSAPPDLWLAGDTGRARSLLLRAHPILTEGERFWTERMARFFAHESTEVQRWWRVGSSRTGIATFVDTGVTARRLSGGSITDVDVGIGLRGAYPGRAGALRLDIARGIRDGHVAISVAYSADITH